MPEARLARTRRAYGPERRSDHDELLALMRESSVYFQPIRLVPGLKLRANDGREWLIGDDYLARRVDRTPAWQAPHLNASEQLHRKANVGVIPGSPLAAGAGQTGETITVHGFSVGRDLGDEHGT